MRLSQNDKSKIEAEILIKKRTAAILLAQVYGLENRLRACGEMVHAAVSKTVGKLS